MLVLLCCQEAFAAHQSLERLLVEGRLRAAVLRLGWLAGVNAEELPMPKLAAWQPQRRTLLFLFVGTSGGPYSPLSIPVLRQTRYIPGPTMASLQTLSSRREDWSMCSSLRENSPTECLRGWGFIWNLGQRQLWHGCTSLTKDWDPGSHAPGVESGRSRYPDPRSLGRKS